MRLRQVVLAAPRLAPVAERLQAALDLPDPYHDPGVREFGLENAVFAVGDTFLEVVSPVAAGTAAGRYLERRGRPEAAGYMAIFQVADADGLAAARERVAAIGVRTVWQADLPDIAGTHLHPADVPGAIVSIDWADPPESWRWGGPRWTGGAPAEAGSADVGPGRVAGFTVAVGAETPLGGPDAVERRWAEVLGTAPSELGIEFAAARAGGPDGIVEIRLDRRAGAAEPVDLAVGTVRLRN